MSNDLNKIMEEDRTPEEVDAILEAVLQAKFDAELKMDLEKDLDQQYQVSKTNETGKIVDLAKRKRSRLVYYLSAVAAGVALLIVALTIFNSPADNGQALAAAYLTESEIYHSGAVKGNTNGEEIRMQAIRAFNAQQYAEAEQYFSQLEEKTEEDSFYSGVASLLNQNYDAATENLTLVIKNGSTFKTEASWYLAIAYVLQGEAARARDLLLQVKDSTWNQNKTKQLLEALK